MIKRLKYCDIDWEKYHHCLENSEQNNFYARKHNLDFLAENWEILILGNYEAVLPIPLKKKWGVSFVLMPLFCQQLGVFSKKDDEKINQKFLIFLEKNYRVYFYAFNSKNKFTIDLEMCNNYFITSQNYLLLRKKYFKGRKSTVKSAQNLSIKELFLDQDIINFISNNFKGLTKNSDKIIFIEYLKFLNENENIIIWGSFLENTLTNLALLIKSERQLTLLGLLNNEKYKKQNGASFLIDHILKDNIDQISLDLMGGKMRGIEIFFKSFGSELQKYSVIRNSKINMLKKIFTK